MSWYERYQNERWLSDEIDARKKGNWRYGAMILDGIEFDLDSMKEAKSRWDEYKDSGRKVNIYFFDKWGDDINIFLDGEMMKEIPSNLDGASFIINWKAINKAAQKDSGV